jgi:ABC-2 type transport system ATP-binding protein
MSTAPVILAEGLTKRFTRPRGSFRLRGPEVKAVDNLDLSLPSGDLLGILGPNGAGKSTFLKLMATLLLPTSGRLLVCGHDTTRRAVDVRARVGYVGGDDRSFYWRLTGRQNLSFFGSLHGLDASRIRARTEDVSSALGLGEVMDSPVDTYSSGMRQRLALARCLLHEPELLLLDEPTRSLDPDAADALRRLIVSLAREGGHTVVLVTHSNDEAKAICTRIGRMQDGRLSLQAPS